MNNDPCSSQLSSQPAPARAPLASRLRGWLPSKGNILFTLLVVGSLVWATKAGAVSLGAPAATGASNSTIAYQGRLTDPGGAPLSGTYPMVFRFYNSATGGSPLWEENWTSSNSVQVSNGLFNVMLGSLNAIPQSLFNANESLWLGIAVGTDAEMTPRVQMGSVPYAFRASQANRAYGLSAPNGGPADALTVKNDGKISIGAVSQDAKVQVGGQGGLLRLWNDDAASVSTSYVDFSLGNTNSPGPYGKNNWFDIVSYGDGYAGTLSNNGGTSLPLDRADVLEADGESMIFANYLNKPFYFYQGGVYESSSRVPLTIAGNGNVGVGTTNPGATFQVNGTVKMLGYRDPNFSFNTQYTAGTDGFVLASAGCGGYVSLQGMTGHTGPDGNWAYIDSGGNNGTQNITMPVRDGDIWIVYNSCGSTAGAIYWIPFGN